jgi:SOS-response transcriptional repressor LexA
MTPKDRLVESLKELCRVQGGYKAVADKAGVDDQSIYQIISGVKLPSGNPKGVGPKIQTALTRSFPGWEALGGQETPNVTPGPDIRGSVPLLSSVQAGAFKEVLDSGYSGGDGVVMIPTTVPVNRYTFALRVQGDSMEPRFTEGMLLIVEPELDAQHGDYVIVKNGSEEATFKQLVKDGGDWFLKPLNPRYPIKPLGESAVIGVVRGVSEMFR